MHIYAFGSICRGDVSPSSDIDLLALVDGHDSRFDPEVFSIYSHKRIREIWNEGNPFAWHLSLEGKLLFASDESDFLGALGRPAPYKHGYRDCNKFRALFLEARASVEANSLSQAFDLSTVFLSIRNIATCFSLAFLGNPDFSRHSSLRLSEHPLQLSPDPYSVLERARILCTRGYGTTIQPAEAQLAIAQLPLVEQWMNTLVLEAKRRAA
jgi:hypothetical protein